METFIANFTEGELTPVDVVSELTGLTKEEILKSDKFEKMTVVYDVQ